MWAGLVLQEVYGLAPDATIPAVTRNTVSRVLWSLEKRGILEPAPEVRGFRLSDLTKPQSEGEHPPKAPEGVLLANRHGSQ